MLSLLRRQLRLIPLLPPFLCCLEACRIPWWIWIWWVVCLYRPGLSIPWTILCCSWTIQWWVGTWIPCWILWWDFQVVSSPITWWEAILWWVVCKQTIQAMSWQMSIQVFFHRNFLCLFQPLRPHCPPPSSSLHNTSANATPQSTSAGGATLLSSPRFPSGPSPSATSVPPRTDAPPPVASRGGYSTYHTEGGGYRGRGQIATSFYDHRPADKR